MKVKVMTAILKSLIRYKAWANELTYESVSKLPVGEAEKLRQTNFKSIVHTLNHTYVIDDIFKHHLQKIKHGYIARNTKQCPTLINLWSKHQQMDVWWVEFVDNLTPEYASQDVKFEFVGGGEGCMTVEEIIMHIVNHGTYHRGFVNDMLYQVPAMPPANDYPVFLRENRN
jgi:uncharacterized damage-inducible protein DinB